MDVVDSLGETARQRAIQPNAHRVEQAIVIDWRTRRVFGDDLEQGGRFFMALFASKRLLAPLQGGCTLRPHLVWTVVLTLGISAAHTTGVHAQEDALSGLLGPGWNLVELSFTRTTIPAHWAESGVRVWAVPAVGTSVEVLSLRDRDSDHKPSSPWLPRGVYWVHANATKTFEFRKDQETMSMPLPASDLDRGWSIVGATQQKDLIRSGGGRLLRWDRAVSAYVPVAEGDILQPGSGYLVDLSKSAAGHAQTDDEGAEVNQTSALAVAADAPPAATPMGTLGQFEPPGWLEVAGGPAFLARAELSEVSGRVLAHVAYVVRGKDTHQADEIRYLRSEKAGKAGSFSHSLRFSVGGSVGDFAMAAEANRVALGWIVRVGEPGLRDGAITHAANKVSEVRVVVVQSEDGGRSFGPETVVRSNGVWKRGLDMAYDARLAHHLVWGEANKAYYLKDLAGSPSNVFDGERLHTSPEEVKYLAREDSAQGCTCIECWCEESYVVDERAVDGDAQTGGSRGYRLTRHVVQPSLHIGDDMVSIAVRQIRAWDPRPVVHPPWVATMASPRYRDEVVDLGGRQIRWPTGWRRVWKTAYEPGDEAMWATLGAHYQYRYSGTWYESDEITLAQRPLTPSGGVAEKLSTSPWRISTVASVGAGDGDDKPSYPQLAGGAGRLVLVYEDGVSDDPNRLGHNAIRFQSSKDRGQSWSSAETVGSGYVPAVGILFSGAVRVLYYEPTSAQEGVVVSRPVPGTASRIGSKPAKPIHFKGHGADSDALEGGVSLATHRGLFLAAWIEQVNGRDQIATSRASFVDEGVGYSVELPSHLTQGAQAKVTVTAHNRYHMRVHSDEVLQVTSMLGAQGGSSLPRSSQDDETLADGLQGSGFQVSLKAGQVSFWADPTDLQILGRSGLAQLSATPVTEGAVLVEGASGSPTLQFSASSRGNYAKAKWMRDRLWREVQGGSGTSGEPVGYQVEYQAVASDEPGFETQPESGLSQWEGKSQDSKVLAKNERVWAYTQGITLAQYARAGDPLMEQRAHALARYMCARAVREGVSGEDGSVIRGWPFSWNTLEDSWKDARLVTGATAWVVHGLGVYLVSEAFQSLEPAEKRLQRGCYHEALRGLEIHRRAVSAGDGRRYSLMTAGWTTKGLRNAGQPWRLQGPDGQPLADQGEQWDYYDILDAIGYDTLDPKAETVVGRVFEGPSAVGAEPEVLSPRVLTEPELSVLGQVVQAENVVTEHNLDVLSVLNHALRYAPQLGLENTAHLSEWRDDLRNGIFQVLWDRDDVEWRRELEAALDHSVSTPSKEAEIRDALSRGTWGRVVTGGELVGGREEAEVYGFVPNKKHTAIDNCSWLSLSVDYEALTDRDDIESLARCLEFTALAFGKNIMFEGKSYYGAHYFFDGFEDPYIAATDRQERSYHLEATAGLVMGLLAFAKHHPRHPRSDYFLREADSLWQGMQAFVLDHDFPYSSQRIIDLSTLLTSSTALIWFIDAYRAMRGAGLSGLGPKEDDVAGSADAMGATVIMPPGPAFLLGAQNLSLDAGSPQVVQLSVLRWFSQLAGPQLTKEPMRIIVKESVKKGAQQVLKAEGGKSVSQLIWGELIVTALGGTILGAEASKALLAFVNENAWPTVHNIYIWRSETAVEIPHGFHAIFTDAFSEPGAVESMSVLEKALLAELELGPINWSAPETWGQSPLQTRPLVDLALLGNLETDILLVEGPEDVSLYYAPRTSGVGGYVVQVDDHGLQVIDRHRGETSAVSADLSPVELAALLRLPDLIRAWILSAPEPNQRGLLEEYLSQWILTGFTNPVRAGQARGLPASSPKARKETASVPSSGVAPITRGTTNAGTSDDKREASGHADEDTEPVDLRETFFSVLGETELEIARRVADLSEEALAALYEEVPDPEREAAEDAVHKILMEDAWEAYVKYRISHGAGVPPDKVYPTFYVEDSNKTFEGVSLPGLSTHPLQQHLELRALPSVVEKAFDGHLELKRDKKGELEHEMFPVNAWTVPKNRPPEFMATEYRHAINLKDGGRLIVEYLEKKFRAPRTPTELMVMLSKLSKEKREKLEDMRDKLDIYQAIPYMNRLLEGTAPGVLEREIRQETEDPKEVRYNLRLFGRAQKYLKSGIRPGDLETDGTTFQELRDEADGLTRQSFGLNWGEFLALFQRD